MYAIFAGIDHGEKVEVRNIAEALEIADAFDCLAFVITYTSRRGKYKSCTYSRRKDLWGSYRGLPPNDWTPVNADGTLKIGG